MRGDEQFKFEGPERRRLLADLRAAWRERYPDEAPPAAQDLNAAVEDLRRLAERPTPTRLAPRTWPPISSRLTASARYRTTAG